MDMNLSNAVFAIAAVLEPVSARPSDQLGSFAGAAKAKRQNRQKSTKRLDLSLSLSLSLSLERETLHALSLSLSLSRVQKTPPLGENVNTHTEMGSGIPKRIHSRDLSVDWWGRCDRVSCALRLTHRLVSVPTGCGGRLLRASRNRLGLSLLRVFPARGAGASFAARRRLATRIFVGSISLSLSQNLSGGFS